MSLLHANDAVPNSQGPERVVDPASFRLLPLEQRRRSDIRDRRRRSSAEESPVALVPGAAAWREAEADVRRSDDGRRRVPLASLRRRLSLPLSSLPELRRDERRQAGGRGRSRGQGVRARDRGGGSSRARARRRHQRDEERSAAADGELARGGGVGPRPGPAGVRDLLRRRRAGVRDGGGRPRGGREAAASGASGARRERRPTGQGGARRRGRPGARGAGRRRRRPPPLPPPPSAPSWDAFRCAASSSEIVAAARGWRLRLRRRRWYRPPARAWC